MISSRNLAAGMTGGPMVSAQGEALGGTRGVWAWPHSVCPTTSPSVSPTTADPTLTICCACLQLSKAQTKHRAIVPNSPPPPGNRHRAPSPFPAHPCRPLRATPDLPQPQITTASGRHQHVAPPTWHKPTSQPPATVLPLIARRSLVPRQLEDMAARATKHRPHPNRPIPARRRRKDEFVPRAPPPRHCSTFHRTRIRAQVLPGIRRLVSFRGVLKRARAPIECLHVPFMPNEALQHCHAKSVDDHLIRK